MMIPKIIWTYWDQGITNSPNIVKACVRSWEKNNPGWEIRALDASTASHYSTISKEIYWEKLPLEKRSDLLRLELLEKYGGVWVDATLFCTNPLENWLPPNPRTGFIVFDLPKTANRFFSSFFVAAKPHNYLVSRWHGAHKAYMRHSPKPMRYSRKRYLMAKFPFLWSRFGAIVHTLGLFRNRWGFPYFILHYHANREILLNPVVGLLWLFRNRRTCKTFHTMVDQDLAIREFSREIKNQTGTAWKLTRRHELPPELQQLIAAA